MNAQDWIILIVLGGLLGMVGQGIRIAAGLKKMNDEASSTGATTGDLLKPSRIMVSLLIGFVAGVLGAVGLEGATGAAPAGPEVTKVGEAAKGLIFGGERIVTLIGIGYAGADFIEAFMSKYSGTFAKNGATEHPPDGAPPAMG